MNGSSTSLTVAHAIVQALVDEGVDRVFGLPGSHVLGLFDAIIDTPITCVSAIHENSATAMAGMHGYLTGKPGVALLTAGPGATNSLTAVAQAYAASLPMVHICGDVEVQSRREAFHGTDRSDFLHRVFAPVTKWSLRLESPEGVGATVAQAFAIARSGRPGPVHISVPLDLARVRVTDCQPQVPMVPVPVQPSADFVARVVEQLQHAKRPVICACRGVLVEGANQELEGLADVLHAPVLATSYGLGAIRQDHPLAIGTFSEFSQNTFAFDTIRNCDFLLLVGLRANTNLTRILAQHAPAASALVAFEDPSELVHEWPGAVEACSIKAFLRAVLRHAEHVQRPSVAGLEADIAEQERAFCRGMAATLADYADHEPLHFGVVLQALSKHLRHDAIAVSGVGHHHVWARNLLPVRDRTSFIAEASWGTMGSEVAGGISAKLVYPERQVVVITGDASLLMVAGDLVTAVKERANILIVVLNDGQHGIIGAMQRHTFGRAHGETIGPVNFAELARSVGALGLRVTSPVELAATLAAAIAASRHTPTVLDVVCGASFPWPIRDQLVAKGRSLSFGGES